MLKISRYCPFKRMAKNKWKGGGWEGEMDGRRKRIGEEQKRMEWSWNRVGLWMEVMEEVMRERVKRQIKEWWTICTDFDITLCFGWILTRILLISISHFQYLLL